MNLLKNRVRPVNVAGALSLLLCVASPQVSARQAPTQPDLVNQAKGEAALAAGREHMLAHRWVQAVDAFQQALTFLPGNLEAIDGIRRAQASLEDGSTLGGVAADIEVQRGRAIAEFDASVAEAQRLLAQKDFAGAYRSALTAQIINRQSRGYFSGAEYNDRNATAEILLSTIETAREQDRLERAAQDQREASSTRDVALREEQQQRNRLILENLERIRQLQSELKYEEALQVIDEILFLDERNPTARLLRDAIRTTVFYRQYAELQRQREWGEGHIAMENARGLIPPQTNITGPGDKSVSGIVTYPEDWANLSLRRTADMGMGESPANQRVASVLAQTSIPAADFQDNPFRDVVAFLGQVTDQNFYVDWKALDMIGVSPEDPVTLQLANISAATVVDRVLEQVGNGIDRPQWAIQDGIVTISSEDSLRQDTLTVVYDIRDLLFQVPYFGNAPELELATAMAQTTASLNASSSGGGFGGGSFGGRGGGASGGGGIFSDPGQEKPRVTREELVEQIVAVVQDTVDPDGWRDMGGDTGTLMELNGNLIITNTIRNHRQIEGLLEELREIRALQINVEGRFLAVSTAWFEQIGVDLDLYFNTNNTARQAQLAADPLAHLSDFFNPDGTLRDPLIYGSLNQTPNTGTPPFINQNSFGQAIGLPVDTNGDGIPDSITYATGPVGSPIRTTQGFAPIGFVQDSLGLINSVADLTGFGEAVMAANPALSLGIQFLDDVQVDLLIQATQADRRSVVLTSPRLTFFNGQRAWVAVADQIAFISALIPITGDGAAAFQPIPGVVSDGVVLDVEGVISADRRYVTMTVIISVSKVVNIREVSTQGAVGGTGQIPGGGSFESTIELPEVEVALVQTTVSVPDKGSVLLGGQRLVTEVEVESGVPILSKIPFINRFFMNRLTSKEEETLLILIRPEIIIQQENEDTLFPGLSDSLGGGASYIQ